MCIHRIGSLVGDSFDLLYSCDLFFSNQIYSHIFIMSLTLYVALKSYLAMVPPLKGRETGPPPDRAVSMLYITNEVNRFASLPVKSIRLKIKMHSSCQKRPATYMTRNRLNWGKGGHLSRYAPDWKDEKTKETETPAIHRTKSKKKLKLHYYRRPCMA